MSATAIIFYVLSAFILGTGILAVTSVKIFRAAIWLLFSLMGVAGLYFWLDANFIAAVQIAVYVGGIVVLIIFSIFLTQQSGRGMPRPPRVRSIASLLAVLLGFVLTYLLIHQYGFRAGNGKMDMSVTRIGTQLLDIDKKGYALPFEVVSILLLSAMVGCIVIAMKTKPDEA
ncbi:MAG: NADH-quinone oxidoreductase subunit J [Bacteroidota bacterium]